MKSVLVKRERERTGKKDTIMVFFFLIDMLILMVFPLPREKRENLEKSKLMYISLSAFSLQKKINDHVVS